LPIIRKRWSKKGKRPIAPVQNKYQWLYVYTYACPLSGETSWLLLPTVNIDLFSISLAAFKKEVDPDNKKIIILLLDQAGFHISQKVTIPEGVIFLPLPAHTPELQPVENIWPYLKESVADESFPNLDALEERLVQRAKYIIDHPETIQGKIAFHWILDVFKQR
jgi:hypothetical protein